MITENVNEKTYGYDYFDLYQQSENIEKVGDHILMFPIELDVKCTEKENKITNHPLISITQSNVFTPETSKKEEKHENENNDFFDWVEYETKNQTTSCQCPPFLKKFLLFNISVFAFLNFAGGIAALVEGTTDINALDFALQSIYEYFGNNEFTHWLNAGFEKDMDEFQDYAQRVGQAQVALNAVWFFGKALSSGAKKIKNCFFSSTEKNEYSLLTSK